MRRLAPLAAIATFIAACSAPGASTEPTSQPPESAASNSPVESASADAGSITVYSGRSEELVGPLLEEFSEATGIEVEARYGDTAEMANLILTEGENSPADVFFAQDAGALGAVAEAGLLAPLPSELVERVDARFRSTSAEWVGVSGRARVVAYNTEALTEADLPDSIFGFTDPEWSGRIGWAPTNGSFQSFVTALRVVEGEDRAREWLERIQANEPNVYDGNSAALEAVAAGEIDVAFINHYYLFQRLAEDPETTAANYFVTDGDPGALVNVAGAGILETAPNAEGATALVDYLLGEQAQAYFATETFEYPLIEGVAADPALPELSEIGTPDIDLSDLSDLEGTLQLLQEVGIL
jgi:iron(III) transport system substrate-binding protein